MKTDFGPWTTSIDTGNNPRLSTIWKRRLNMLQIVSRCRPLRGRTWCCLTLLGLVCCALPTIGPDSLQAQFPAPDSKSNDETAPPLQKVTKVVNLQSPSDLPEPQVPTDSAVTLPEESVFQKTDKPQIKPPGPPRTQPATSFSRLTAPIGAGTSLDLVNLANSYVDAISQLRKRTMLLEQMNAVNRRQPQVIPRIQVLEAEADLEAARLKEELLRKIVLVAEEAAKQQFMIHDIDQRRLEQLVKKGVVTNSKLLEARSRSAQSQSNLTILQLLRESAKTSQEKPRGSKPGRIPERPEQPQKDKSKAELEKTIRKRLGLKLVPAKDFAQPGGQKYRGGLRITEVVTGGPADLQKLRPGDILVGLHKWETLSLENVGYALSNSPDVGTRGLKFYIVRNGETMFGHLSAWIHDNSLPRPPYW